MAESPRDPSAGRPQRRRRGRRRVRARVLTPAAAALIDSRVLETTKRSRSDSTLMSYSKYMNHIHEWYFANEEDLCFPNGKVNSRLIRDLCKTREGLAEQSLTFKRCLLSKEHETDKNDDGTAACARVGTLSGYRSAWGYYIWTENIDPLEVTGIPVEWDATMHDFFKGLKNDEAKRRQTGLLPCKEGKTKMCVALFRHMAAFFHREGKMLAVFNHNWSWNLMCRSFNICLLFAQSLGWGGDCIGCQYGQDKTRKGGGRTNKTAMMKHLFANPHEPEVYLYAAPPTHTLRRP